MAKLLNLFWKNARFSVMTISVTMSARDISTMIEK
jgi:hypothetical protein